MLPRKSHFAPKYFKLCLAPFLVNYVVKMQEYDKFDFMYIASPPAQLDLLKNVRNLVANQIPKFKIYLQSEVKIYM